jgi:hypothetical protein
MSLNYSKTRTFLSDLEILFRTVLGFSSRSVAWGNGKADPTGQTLSEFISRISP